mgnify:CR=1 FL=1
MAAMSHHEAPVSHRLDDMVAIVTGASQGIGAQIAITFAAAGALAFSGLIAQWLLRDRIGRAHDLNTFAAPSVEQA